MQMQFAKERMEKEKKRDIDEEKRRRTNFLKRRLDEEKTPDLVLRNNQPLFLSITHVLVTA
jgi:predicted polyphosphate/ATP-dependent NAD kinase